MPIAHYAPAVYSRFCCTASACSDNCCIGWEIDIDPDTARFYDTLPGPDGEWLRAGISPPGELPRRFCAGEDGRCPFLNENNLCGAYLRLGERAMAEICREHPRFHNWCGPFVESGLGLCCEEACRLILTGREPFRLTRLEDLPDDPEETEEPLEPLLALRRRAFRLLEERPLPEALEALARLGYAAQHCPGAPDRAPLPETALPPLTGQDGAALVEGFAVCSGYSSSFQLLATLAGLECITVRGEANMIREEHAWNMVRLDGEWYCVDVTWDDPSGLGRVSEELKHRYFNVTGEFMRATRHYWDEDGVPEATGTKYAWTP